MPPQKRLSLTKAQIEVGEGAELLSLCQTITADGVLTDDEIHELNSWLEANRNSDLPAIAFLAGTIRDILADGLITLDERRALYEAIEKILPPEARKQATAHRKFVEAEAKATARQARDAQKTLEREQRELLRPVGSFNFMVAGVLHEGRPVVIDRFLAEGGAVYLARDVMNRHSLNAIEIRLANGMQIGFVPEDYAPAAAPYLDDGYPHIAYVTKILCGARGPIPVVQARIYRKDSGIDEAVLPDDVPPKWVPTQGLQRQGGRISTVKIFRYVFYAVAAFMTLRCLL